MLPSSSAMPSTSSGGIQKTLPNGYPRRCAYCNSKTEYYDASEFSRHLRVAHSTKEGGSFVCKYGENGVCPKLPPEGVSDFDYEAHVRKFHTGPEIVSKIDGGETLERSSFTINSCVQNLASALTDPSRSRSEATVFFTRHWGEAFLAGTPPPSSQYLRAIAPPTLLAQLERNLKTYKKFAHTKRTLKKQRAQAVEDERADVDDLPKFLVEDSFDLSSFSSFNALFTRPSDSRPDPLGVPAAKSPVPKPRPTNPFEEEVSPKEKERKTGKNPFETDRPEGRNPFEDDRPVGKNPFDGPEWRDRKALQTRLEAMHDVVDARLASRLRAKSDAFWKIVNSYGGLQVDIKEARERITVIRRSLRVASTSICERTSRLSQQYKEREQKRQLLCKLHDMACLRDAQATVQALLSQGEYPRALECIHTSSDVVNTELAGVLAFRHLSPQLDELRSVIGRMMKEELATLIQREFGAKPDEEGQIVHEGELLSVMLGLAQLRSFSFVAMLKNEIGETTKTIVRQTCKGVIVECGDVNLLDQMGDAVRRLRFRDWLTLLDAVQRTLFSFALRIETLQTLILDLLHRVWPDGFPDEEDLNRHSPTPNGQDQDEDLSDLDESPAISAPSSKPPVPSSAVLPVDIRSLSQLTRSLSALREYAQECAHARLARLVLARDAAGDDKMRALPSVHEMKQQTELVTEYVKRGTDRGWSAGRMLESAIEKSTIEYVERFHRRRKETVCEVLDRELWRPAEVPAAIQDLITAFDGPEEEGGEENEDGEDENGTVVEEAVAAASAKDGSPEPDRSSLPGSAAPSMIGESTTLCIGEERYVVVGSALLTVSALHEHAQLAAALPLIAARLLLRTVELLKAFNSRACQLILGAGALQLVGLKTISVKNLALASRSLQLVAHFIPVLETRFERLLQQQEKGQLRHFQKVRTDFAEHVNEIVSKLVSVIEHHSANCLASWSIGGAPPSSAMQTLCKQLIKFHAGLYGISPDEKIRALFSRVHLNVQRQLREQFGRLKVSPQDVLAYGIVCEDYAYYTKAVRSMPGCADIQLGTMAEVLQAW